jgi:hypothetical protein
MLRYFLVPAVVVNGTRGPKYFTLTARHQTIPGTVLAQWEPIDFGNEPSMLVGTDISDAESATLAGMVDVTKFADDLDTPLGARLVAMQSALEALNLPAQMLTAATLDRTIVRGIMVIFNIGQCMQGKGFNIFAPGITLATTMGSLGAAARTALTDCVDSFGYDRSGITLASTVRDLLTKLATQPPPRVSATSFFAGV